MIYVLYGEDGFSAQETLQGLYAAVGPRDLWESNVTQMDGAGFNWAEFAAMVHTVPFLAERRLVVVRGLLATTEPQRGAPRRSPRSTSRGGARQKNEASPAAKLTDALGDLPPTSDIAFVDERLSTNNPLLQALRPLAQIHDFPVLRRDDLARWVQERMSQKGGSIIPQAVAELVELVGGNLWAMDTELEKLVTYCGDRPADPQDVRNLVTSARVGSIFALVDAIMERSTSAAIGLMEQLLQAGNSGSSLLGLIARQARLVALAHELVAERLPQTEWGGRLGVPQGFVVRKTAEQARRFSPEQVRTLYELLVEADLAMKTGHATDELALVDLIAGLAAPRRSSVSPHS
jgi:DNA polymerase-3 subunit delta